MPPAATSPSTGASMNRKNSDAASAATTVSTPCVRARPRGAGTGAAGSMALRSGSATQGLRSSRAEDDRSVEHVDVRRAQLAARRRRQNLLDKTLGGGGVRRAQWDRERVEN